MITLLKKGKGYFKKKNLTGKTPNLPKQSASSETCSTYDTPPSSPEAYSKPHTPSSSSEACSVPPTSPTSPKIYSKPHTPSSSSVPHTSSTSPETYSKPHTPSSSETHSAELETRLSPEEVNNATQARNTDVPDAPSSISETHSAPVTPSSSSETRTLDTSPESPHARKENQNDNLPRQLDPNRSISGLEPLEIEEVSRKLIKKYKGWSKEAKKRRHTRLPEHKALYERKLNRYIIQLRDEELRRENVPVNRETVVANLDTFVVFLERLNTLNERTAANISKLFYELFNGENNVLFGEAMFASNRTKKKQAIEEHIIKKRYEESNPPK
ncbi:hypothetical protein BCV72DRAFT_326278 [Rhizopus microsporus var. microsporus]|uniref:Uncharacterized protein n=2 Tax=Rhizopus microsporus TaxID=58291 RepID=A0A2G4SU94_RHIZD|nr:uncharacterized protein RHIMIDRAFT_238137 [Rhizopus microsporus ATCC 52813]ORE11449.1 hypothetical protein BCV72DRAFT_326278 [Rhizopus microsporus var. microsporus]PHZ12330.1 hypothetical protein RHIMIDRAFT_238137 [Rhizopus microsporus ATCC 52813]